MRKRVHWLAVQPTPYNDYLFRALAADPSIDLTVHFRATVASSHPWKERLAVGFPSRTYSKRLGIDWETIRLAALDRKAFFIIAGWDHITAQLATLLRAIDGRYAIWTDTPLDRDRPALKAVLRKEFLRLIFRTARRVMGTGHAGVNALESLGCPRDKLVVFPFFVDLEALHAANRRERRPLTFASSGRIWLEMKGQDVAIRALRSAMDQTGFSDFRYRIAGSGPDEAQLRGLIADLGLTEHVEFTGWIEGNSLPSFYASAEMLLHPARFDPFPVAVLESMAAGLVILGSSAAGSVRDRVREGVNGFVHRPGDVGKLTEDIVTLFRQPTRIVEMGRDSRRTAEEWPVTRGVALVKEIIGL